MTWLERATRKKNPEKDPRELKSLVKGFFGEKLTWKKVCKITDSK